jgi:hypothetical protein
VVDIFRKQRADPNAGIDDDFAHSRSSAMASAAERPSGQ